MNSQPDADLQAVQSPEHGLVSNKQEEPVRCKLTSCSKTQSIFLSATSRKGQSHTNLHTVQTQSMLLSASDDKPKQNFNLHAIYNQNNFMLASSSDQLAIGLLPV